jgi:hypothetical protein
MVRQDIFDRDLLKSLPVNAGIRIEAGQSGLFSGFKPKVMLAGLCLSPFEDFIASETVHSRIGYSELERALDDVLDKELEWNFLGVMAPTGFSGECLASIPMGRNYSCLLIEKGASTEWKVHGSGASEWAGAIDFFELETREEKFARCTLALRDHPELRLKGGHIQIEKTKGELGFPEDLFDEALEALVKDSQEYVVRQFDGVKILQRSRF